MQENISESLSLGYLPEATHWIGGEDLSLLAESKTLLPLPSTLNGKPIQSILNKEAYNSVLVSGEAIVLPIAIHLQSSAVYNKKVLAQIGQSEIPMDWDTFLWSIDEFW